MKNKIFWSDIVRGNEIPDLVISTPLGPFASNDPNNPFSQFDFQIMHTNFRIMKSMIYILNNTSGVQSITVISPFMAIISVGRLFKKEKVKQLVELRLTGKILNSAMTIDNLPENLRGKLKSKFGSLVFPNGEVLGLEADTYDDGNEVFEKAAELCGGVYSEPNKE